MFSRPLFGIHNRGVGLGALCVFRMSLSQQLQRFLVGFRLGKISWKYLSRTSQFCRDGDRSQVLITMIAVPALLRASSLVERLCRVDFVYPHRHYARASDEAVKP